MKDRRYHIIGAGRFGRQALAALWQRQKGRGITIVDPNAGSLAKARVSGFQAACLPEDGVAYLARKRFDRSVDWVIPALPRHLAYEWLYACAKIDGGLALSPLDLDRQVMEQLPNPMPGGKGQLFASNADFRCPADCPEPRDICLHTGKKRLKNLYERIGDMALPGIRNLVIRSRQLSPGVGGYPYAELEDVLAAVSGGGDFLLATACRCHGVANMFRVTAVDSRKRLSRIPEERIRESDV